jgi:hypothetical protein
VRTVLSEDVFMRFLFSMAPGQVREASAAPSLAERLSDLLRLEQQTLWTTRRMRVAWLAQRRHPRQ